MSVDLKIEFSGAVVLVRRKVASVETVIALLLGRGGPHAGHMSGHRPTFILDPADVRDVKGLPARIVQTGKRRLGLQVDMTGLDLVLADAAGGGVVVDPIGHGLPFARVVDMQKLLVAGSPATKAHPGLIDRTTLPVKPDLVVGRVFLDAGRLFAVAPVETAHLTTEWNFDYKDSGGASHTQLTALATDRIAFRCRLTDAALNFKRHGSADQRFVRFHGTGRPPVTARLSCAPGLTEADAAAGKVLSVDAMESHFEMAYETLEHPPKYFPAPVPKSSYAFPGKNCFKAAQVGA